MHELIPLHQSAIGSNTIQTVNARELHTFLGPKAKFTDWIVRRISAYGFEEGRDFTTLNSEKGPVRTIEYHVSIDMAKELSMVERTKRGKEARQYFLDCERRSQGPTLPTLHDPSLQALMHVMLDLDATKHQLAQVEAQAERANTKADMALADAHRMTLEEFILKNGLYRQFPPSQYKRISAWLVHFCQQYGLAFPKAPVLGKSWDEENAYPLQAIAAWLRYEQKRPQQGTLTILPGGA